MSGGSLNYVSGHVEGAAETIDRRSRQEADNADARRVLRLRRAFARHLRLVAEALHAVEWSLSGDTGFGDDAPAIERVLGKSLHAVEVAELIAELAPAVNDAREALRNLESMQ